ncbi:uncharacterized protein LOC127002103 isoform X1 [Eriocheir sinensis]|uniref:uncharacterized protein LOC127002103 isoform X1 n=1 Tax=Eriocheir sinensis TaxID=95602 RepID=UPI0021C6BA7B|nr:uncharacterized protein LOC127002103 isoform X1 [Eriocheir sinensis]
MKLLAVAVVVVLAVASSVEGQFPFRSLPSPPEIIFGAFRPLFQPFLRSRPRQPRPVRPFRPFGPGVFCSPRGRGCRFFRLENQRPLQSPPRPPPPPQVFQPSPPRPFPPQQAFQPQQQPVFQQHQQPNPAPRPQQQFVQSPPDLSNFGAPRPDTILNSPSSPQGPPRPRPNIQPRPNQPQPFAPSQPFPQPIPDLNDNNIIGMTPPPPPPPPRRPLPQPPSPPRARPQPTQRPRPPQPQPQPPSPPPPPPRKKPVTSPKGNAIDGLLVNPVPSVNAGVLPLANEKPDQPQFFPPLVGIS